MWRITTQSCNCVNAQGTVPLTAFVFNAFIISVSTAIGEASREAYDPTGASGVGFLVYIVIVFFSALATHLVLMFFCRFGGGMLAEQNQLEATARFLVTGTTTPHTPILAL